MSDSQRHVLTRLVDTQSELLALLAQDHPDSAQVERGIATIDQLQRELVAFASPASVPADLIALAAEAERLARALAEAAGQTQTALTLDMRDADRRAQGLRGYGQNRLVGESRFIDREM